jgi:hypothetical protein
MFTLGSYKSMGSNNLITTQKMVVKQKKIKNKMETLEGRDCLLFTCHHATTTIFCKPKKDPQPFVDLL